MNKSILITGIAGTGKSAVCDELNKLGYKAFDIEDIEGLFTMVNKKTGKPFRNYDNDNFENVIQGDWICNKAKLQRLKNKNTGEIIFYCGIASNLDELIPIFDTIFLLKVSKKILRQRLSIRTLHDFGRTAEVQKWIFSWKSVWENHMKKKVQSSLMQVAHLKKLQRISLERVNHLSRWRTDFV